MSKSRKTIHTTLNLSAVLMSQALELFGNMNKTEIIHEALNRLIYSEQLKRHALKWAGKAKIVTHG